MGETERPDAAFFTDEGERRARVPAVFLVQLAASQAEIGPFAGRDRETPLVGARRYHEGLARRPPLRLLRSA